MIIVLLLYFFLSLPTGGYLITALNVGPPRIFGNSATSGLQQRHRRNDGHSSMWPKWSHFASIRIRNPCLVQFVAGYHQRPRCMIVGDWWQRRNGWFLQKLNEFKICYFFCNLVSFKFEIESYIFAYRTFPNWKRWWCLLGIHVAEVCRHVPWQLALWSTGWYRRVPYDRLDEQLGWSILCQ